MELELGQDLRDSYDYSPDVGSGEDLNQFSDICSSSEIILVVSTHAT